MPIQALLDIWPVVYATILEFWRLTDAPVVAAAACSGVPADLHGYVEVGLDDFSISHFEKRTPYANPESYGPLFATLAAQGWIEPVGDQRYRVTEQARAAVYQVGRAADEALGRLDVLSPAEAARLLALLKRLVAANATAPEPPEKWAIFHRFRVADETSPLLGQAREYVLDLFAYRDDAHLSAWRPYGVQGLVWNAFTLIWQGAASPLQIAEQAALRGYAANDYEPAISELVRRGWVEEVELPGTYQVSREGRSLREAVERLTDAYFYAPWSCLGKSEIVELRGLLIRLRERLQVLPSEQHS